MNKEILKYPDPFLKTVCEPVLELNDETKSIIIDLVETLKLSTSGVGLAAPQIGYNKRIFCMKNLTGDIKVVINPIIHSMNMKSKIKNLEGCLSVQFFSAQLMRYGEIDVEYRDVNFNTVEETLNNQEAIIFQHEFDHLNGILFIDRLSRLQKEIYKKKLKRIL